MILGHERQIDYLNKVLKNGRMAHAYLFYGPKHIGKFTAARALAKSLYCQDVKEFGGCGECGSCQSIDNYTYPHVLVLDLEHTLLSKKDKRKDIPIGDIRELKRIFSLSPEGDTWRVAIINEAEKMSQEASNALLKLLEEPGPRTLLILVSSNPEFLLPTIVSRTQGIRFSNVSRSVLEKFLEPKIKDASLREEMLSVAGGRPGILVNLLLNKNALASELKFLREIDLVLKSEDVPGAFSLSEEMYGDEEKRETAVEYVLSYLRSRLIEFALEGSSEAEVAGEKVKKISKIASILSTTNVNPRLAMDVMFLEAMRAQKID